MNCTIALILARLMCGVFAEGPIDSTDGWIENPRVYTVAEQHYLCRTTSFAEQASRRVEVDRKSVRHLYGEEWDIWCRVLFGEAGDMVWNAIMRFRDHRFRWDGSFREGLHRCEWDDAIAMMVVHKGFGVSLCLSVDDLDRHGILYDPDWQRWKDDPRARSWH